MAALLHQATPDAVGGNLNTESLSPHAVPDIKEQAQQELGGNLVVEGLSESVKATTDPSTLGPLLDRHGGEPDTVRTIANQIRKFGDERCEEALVNYLIRHGSTAEHRAGVESCMEALRALSLDGKVDPKNLERAILPLVSSPDVGLRRTALFTLGEHGHPKALEELYRIRTDRSEDLSVRFQALNLLPEGNQRILENMLREKLPPEVEAQVLWALYDREGPYRYEAFYRLNRASTSPELRGALITYGMGAQGPVSDDMIVHACAAPDFQVAIAGAIAAQIRSGKEGPDILRRALAATEKAGQSESALLLDGLAAVGDPADRDRFEKILTSEASGGVRDTAFRYFARVDPAYALEAARADLKREDGVKAGVSAVNVLLAAGNPTDDPLIVGAIKKVSPYGELDRVIEAIEEHKRIDLLEPLRTRADHRDPVAYEKIVRALARSGDDTAVKELLSTPIERSYRRELFESLAKSPAPSALEATYAALSSPEAVGRLAIGRSLGASSAEFSRYVRNLSASGDPKLTAFADDLVRAKTLGIEYPLRFRPIDLHHIVETRRSNAPPKEGEPQALIVLPRSDPNNAFYGVAPMVASLRERGYRVVLHEAESESDVLSALRSQTRYGASDFIVLGAHGAKNMMSFGGADPAHGVVASESLAIDLSDKAQFKTADVRGALKEGGHLMLLSCSTGEGGARAQNMANMMREIFPHAAKDGISAPPIPVRAGKPIEFDDAGKPIQLEEPWIRYYLTEGTDEASRGEETVRA